MFDRRMRFIVLALASALLVPAGRAQNTGATFDPRETFAPLTLPEPVNAYRSSNGAPGPMYWQNEASYELHTALDTTAKTLTTSEIITYTNNSPDVLPSLWILMEQNIYRKDSRARNMGGAARGRRGGDPNAEAPSTEGYILESVEIESGKGAKPVKAEYVVSDTRMQVRLATPLAPKGQLKLHIKYHYAIPGVWGGRTSWGMSEKGEIYDLAQWYPRMCVYDDLRGWDTLPYIGAEFYLEYGHFDTYITAPSDMVVIGGGELVNPKDVLTSTQITRMEQAKNSDATVYIRTPAEVTAALSQPKATGTKTWHYHMDHTRDVAWTASPVFVWDAAKINLPDGKKSLAMSVYPLESVGADAWDKSTEYVKDSVEHFSKQWFPYQWPTAVSVAGFSTGMEYPGMVFDGIKDKGSFLFWVTAHEIGHDWFPMIVGSNERRNAFMDEGFNTFIDIDESAAYAGGKYGPKRDSEYSAGGEPPDTILKLMDNAAAPVMMMAADAYPGQLGHPVSYFKGAYGMVLLREQILGPERFDWAFRKYVKDWAYKHPAPSDFFRAMQSEGGEDLSYFWRGWYMNNWKYDVSVDKIDNATVTIVNKGQLVLPTTVEIKLKDGTTTRVKIPVEAWLAKATWLWIAPGGKAIASVLVDPDHMMPDDDRTNNTKSAE
ncbi:M1 family metallopeptidase [soil metagenome]